MVTVRAFLSAALIILVSQFCGCGSSGDPGIGEVEGTRMSRAAFSSGCRVVCATCAPGTLCPHHCTLDCPKDTVPCGSTVCQGGDVCCNDSCGICTPPGGVCTQQFCAPTPVCVDTVLCIRGFHWSPTQCACVPDLKPGPGDECSSDGDCRLFADYCTGCDCRSLPSAEPDPTCSGPGVRCFADPCLGKAAVCVAGQCIESPGQPQTRRRTHAPHRPHAPHAPHAPGQPVG